MPGHLSARLFLHGFAGATAKLNLALLAYNLRRIMKILRGTIARKNAKAD